ncbi:tetratricopeptide repeat protein [Geomonas sp. Red69]|uniref:tetratricopeptide repeat protein n=1 Tax=Geomonas diazotrophica TaxID=2843197 RepID=UPI001C0FFF5B|nr:tetratricopeptide repeat protein [Geomonas diazotrophica]MBU5637914.1 tetratricopeptide repeat protein [Geomonas diazotrophica]
MRIRYIFSLVLVIVTLAVFAKTATHEFINLDDPGYVTNNPVVKHGLTSAGFVWAFTSTTMSNWHPVTWLSHMTDVQLFGLKPAGHHMVSVVLHAVAALLLFLLLVRLTDATWPSFYVAALFALHPLHVESVAWVAERKDVLSCVLMLLATHCYVSYAKSGRIAGYLGSLLLFLFGLMAKPMLVTFPVILLLLDYWPLNRLAPASPDVDAVSPARRLMNLIKEKVPFLLLTLVSAAVTIYGQHKGGAMATLDKAPIVLRVENAIVAYIKYIGLMFWPSDLGILYPFPKSVPLWLVLGSFLLLCTISLLVVRFGRRFPYLVTGWLWYMITLLPVIGLIQVGGQSMADRYTYIPLIGLFIALCWLVTDVSRGWRQREAILAGGGAAVLITLAALTWLQLDYWKNSLTICRHTLAVTRDNYLITNNYGIALDERGDHAGAYRLFKETLEIYPGSATAYTNLGAICVRWGRYPEALDYYQKALAVVPDHAIAWAGLGKALAGLGRQAEAIAALEQSLQIDPNRPEPHIDLAAAFLQAGRTAEAMQHKQMAKELGPVSTGAAINMGVGFAKEGRLAEALEQFNGAIELDPDSVEAHFNRGVVLAKLNRPDEAAADFQKVLQVSPGTSAARDWLARLGRK